jgi:hypothetical protein
MKILPGKIWKDLSQIYRSNIFKPHTVLVWGFLLIDKKQIYRIVDSGIDTE